MYRTQLIASVAAPRTSSSECVSVAFPLLFFAFQSPPALALVAFPRLHVAPVCLLLRSLFYHTSLLYFPCTASFFPCFSLTVCPSVGSLTSRRLSPLCVCQWGCACCFLCSSRSRLIKMCARLKGDCCWFRIRLMRGGGVGLLWRAVCTECRVCPELAKKKEFA